MCDTVLNYYIKTVLGDFNTEVGKDSSYIWHVKGTAFGKTSDNGKRKVNFTLGRDSAVTGTWYQHKDIHKDHLTTKCVTAEITYWSTEETAQIFVM